MQKGGGHFTTEPEVNVIEFEFMGRRYAVLVARLNAAAEISGEAVPAVQGDLEAAGYQPFALPLQLRETAACTRRPRCEAADHYEECPYFGEPRCSHGNLLRNCFGNH